MKKLFKPDAQNGRQNMPSIILSLAASIILALLSVYFLFVKSYKKLFFCVMALALIALLPLAERLLSIKPHAFLECAIILFIFAAVVGGDVFGLYTRLPCFDTILHAICGFLSAGFGFGLLCMLVKKSGFERLPTLALSLLFIFCFSMSVAVFWEFIEFSSDRVLKTDAQKDAVAANISSSFIDQSGTDTPVKVKNIDKTVCYDSKGNIIFVAEGGCLDIGLFDTIKDMFFNFIGALIFIPFAALNIKDGKKYTFASKFTIKEAKKAPKG